MSVGEKADPTEQPTTGAESVPATAPEPESAPSPARVGALTKTRGFVTSRWKGLTLTALLLCAAVFAGVVYVSSFQPDRRTDASARQVAIDEASNSTVALLSYSPETLDTDMERARTLMTGDFLTYYGKFSAEVVAPAVRERGITARAQVLNAAVLEMQPDSAKVLIFLNQETVSRERPEPALTASSVVVSMSRSAGHWQISALDPV